MTRRMAAAAVLAALLAGSAVSLAAARAPSLAITGSERAQMVTVRARETGERIAPILAPRWVQTRGPDGESTTATADIVVTYNGFTVEERQAFEAAVVVWESMIVSTRTIRVNATMAELGTGVLGGAGPTTMYLLNDGFAYPAALAEAVCNCEGSDPAEITAVFNSRINWYLGTDGNPPSVRYDLMTVVMHELGHGLGFISSFEIDSSDRGSWGFFSPRRPLRYDTHEYGVASGGSRFTNTSVYPNPSVLLGDQLRDGTVFFGGPNVVAALGGRAKLYAPSFWNPGSSNSHFDEDAFPPGTINSLMTPFLSNGEVVHDPGPVTRALMRDIGWATSGEDPATAPGAATGVTAVAGDTQATVSWTPPASDGGRPISAYTVTSDPGALTCQTLASPCTVTGLTNDVPYTFTVVATNSVGDGPPSAPSNAVTPHFIPDTAGPVSAVPSVAMIAGETLGTDVAVAVSWADAADESGIMRYELQRRKGTNSWVTVPLDTDTSTTAVTRLKPGKTYTFRLRAVDSLGNTGNWAVTSSRKLGLKQEYGSVMSYSKGWTTAQLAGASGGSVRHNASAARWAQLKFTGSSAGFVSTLSPARGIAEMWLDGNYVGFVDLYAPQTTTRAVVWSTGSLAQGAHTLRVYVTGSRNSNSSSNRIDVDAFLVW